MKNGTGVFLFKNHYLISQDAQNEDLKNCFNCYFYHYIYLHLEDTHKVLKLIL